MKTISKTIYLLLISTVLACSDSYFDKRPIDDLTEQGFFDNTDNFKYLINAAYSNLRTVYNNYYLFGDLPSDDVYNDKFNNSITNITLNESNVNSANGVIETFWNASYIVINRCNLVLDNIDESNKDKSNIAQIRGEALFLRSLCYFNLIRIYGDVPLVLNDIKTPEAIYEYERSSVNIIYKEILDNLLFILENNLLPTSYSKNEDIGRATSFAVQALLGHIYLTLHEYENAKIQLQHIIDSNVYHLLPNYEDIFDATNPNNQEIIFAIQYASDFDPSMSSPFHFAALPNEISGEGIYKSGGGGYLITTDLYSKFTENDVRKKMIEYRKGDYREDYKFTTKYKDKTNISKLDPGNDWLVYRFADILLMLAEVNNELGDMKNTDFYLQLVRERAGLEKKEIKSKEEMRLALAEERRLELFCEGHRWFDLLRTGRLIQVMNKHFEGPYSDNEIGSGSNIEEYELIFPLPFSQVDLNPSKLKQNPGY